MISIASTLPKILIMFIDSQFVSLKPRKKRIWLWFILKKELKVMKPLSTKLITMINLMKKTSKISKVIGMCRKNFNKNISSMKIKLTMILNLGMISWLRNNMEKFYNQCRNNLSSNMFQTKRNNKFVEDF